MRYVAVSIDQSRIDKLRWIIPDVEVFEGTRGCDLYNYRQVCIPNTYHRLGEWAVSEGIGRETVVMQDDVWIPHGPGFDNWISEWDAEPFIILGQTEPNGQVAPKAFLAEQFIWRKLAQVWDGEGRIIPAWMPIVEEYGMVLDVTRGLGS